MKTEIILYPTETTSGLGVNVFDQQALQALVDLKGRSAKQATSWLVRSVDDIAQYADVPHSARCIAEAFLPGPVTLVLRANNRVPLYSTAPDGTVGFRVSSDTVAQNLITEFMSVHNAPLSCTSANFHGMDPEATPDQIIAQFGAQAAHITKVIDDGPRTGTPSTVVRVLGESVEILREGVVPASELQQCLL